MLCRKAGRDEGMVLSDRTKGCCSSDLNEPLHPNHDQFAELDAHNLSPTPERVRKPEASRQTSEVGAVCRKAARTVLCGGRPVMGVPTAIRYWARFSRPPERSLSCLPQVRQRKRQ